MSNYIIISESSFSYLQTYSCSLANPVCYMILPSPLHLIEFKSLLSFRGREAHRKNYMWKRKGYNCQYLKRGLTSELIAVMVTLFSFNGRKLVSFIKQ